MSNRILDHAVWLLYLLVISFVSVGYATAAPIKSNANIRAIHFVVSFGITPDQVKSVIDQANSQHFNTLILAVSWRGSTKLVSTPWAHGDRQWSKQELQDVADYARSKGMSVIPAVELLSHQEVFLGNSHPEWMYNTSTYDPRQQAVYDMVFSVLDELIDVFHPKAVHIGHDELAGRMWYRKLLPTKQIGLQGGEQMLPADLFLKDVSLIHDHLKKRNVETWMWSDMLAPSQELPIKQSQNFQGFAMGYGKPLRDKLPHDIVICDEQYASEQADFPALEVLRQEGFRVLGATWRMPETTRNFSHYAAAHGYDGMIATTWFIPGSKAAGAVNNWNDLSKIIRESGEAFIKDFPDAK